MARSFREIVEGFTQGVGNQIRGFFAAAPEIQSAQISRGGMPSSERAGLSYNLASQFGYDSLAQHLRIDQDLQARYTDYEEMDEYPELSCLHGDAPVFTLERGWVPIRDLVGQEFHVLAYDKSCRSLVPAPGTALLSGEEGHAKSMVRVTLDNGEQIICTADHPFLTKDEEWIQAGDLPMWQRLMPGNVRLRSLNAADAAPYWQVHQPHADSSIRSSDGKRWVWLHRVVAEVLLGVEPGAGHVVHHEDHNHLNNAPSNLSIETPSSHAGHHIAGLDNSRFFPEWTDERRSEQAEKMRGNDPIVDGGNHRVLRVERLDERPAIYDLNVPGFHNFVAHGVVVHNTALDIYADDSTMPRLDGDGQSVWVTSDDNTTAKSLNDMLHRNMLVENDNWGLARTLCKYGNCLPAGTRVWTEHGQRAIETIEPGTRVLGYKDGKAVLFTVVKRYENGVKSIFRVRTKHREILATANHPILVDLGGGRTEWRKVSELEVFRYPSGGIDKSKTPKLMIATRAPEVDRNPSWDELFVKVVTPKERSVGGNVVNDFTLPSDPQPWLTRLLGFWWGDGYLATEKTNTGNSTVSYARGINEDQNDYYDGLLRRLDLNPFVSDDGCCTRVHSVLFKCFLLSMGFRNGATKKRLPPWLGMLSMEHRQAFLEGFMDADGWTTSQPTWNRRAYHFEIANVELARDLKNLIDGLGYRSGQLRTRHREAKEIAGKKVKSTTETATLTFSYHEMDSGFMSENLLSVEASGEADVYDIEVDDDAHNFVAEGVVVHNSFGEALASDRGVIGVKYLPPPTIRRVEGPRGELLGFVQDTKGEFNISLEDFYKLAQQRGTQSERSRGPGELTVFEDWEIVHWRLRGKHLRSVYGHGIIDPARWIWKRLALLEDALLIYKLSRAPSRYAFYIDIGEMDGDRGLAYVNRVKNQFVKKRFVNPSTGKLDMRYNPLCLAGDTEVRLLDGSVWAIEDMAGAFDRGEEQWVWASDLDDEGRVRPAKVEWAGVTRRDAQLVKITLDNGKSIRVTPDHKMIRRSGEKVQAQDLVPGDSLMPFRRRISTKAKGEALEGYELIYCPKRRESEYGHRLVAKDLSLSVKGQLKPEGFTSFSDFKRSAIADNHKVVAVEWLDESEDTYTLTVSPCHTFALEAGVFVCNSHDEDFFVPSRNGKDSTRIEVLQGPDYAETDSLEYHRDKLVAALKIPKMYMGYGGEATRGALSSEDTRFARTVMRIQQELCVGYRKLCRIHLIAAGSSNPDAHDFRVNMTVPSSIMELAKLEVMSATADLADRMGERVTTKYVLTSLFKFTDEEAAVLMKGREKEQVDKANLEAKVQKIINSAVPAEEPDAGAQQSPSHDPIQGKSQLTQFDHAELRRRDQLFNHNFERVMRQNHQSWEREFSQKMDSVEKVEKKLARLLEDQPKVLRRMERLEGLLTEVKQAMRYAA